VSDEEAVTTNGTSGRLGEGAVSPMSRCVEDLGRRFPILRPCERDVEAAVEMLKSSLRGGGKVLVCGNGGSAADSEHLVADMMKGFMLGRPIPDADRKRLLAIAGPSADEIAANLQGALAAVALSSEAALTTAIANDVRFDMVFAQQIHGLGTTGNSPNVINAAYVARLHDMKVIALTGRDGGGVATVADVAIRVPAERVPEVQELHLPVYHAIALELEQTFFPDTDDADHEP
jgi:D-sedoheptulose 7-phosphate isomerase